MRNPEERIIKFLESNDNVRFELIDIRGRDGSTVKIVRALNGHSFFLADFAREQIEPDDIIEAVHYTEPRCINSIGHIPSSLPTAHFPAFY